MTSLLEYKTYIVRWKGDDANDSCRYHFDIQSELVRFGIIGLLITFGSFVIALLAFLDRDKDYKRKK